MNTGKCEKSFARVIGSHLLLWPHPRSFPFQGEGCLRQMAAGPSLAFAQRLMGLFTADFFVKVRAGCVLTPDRSLQGVGVFVPEKNEPERIAAKGRPGRWFPARNDLQGRGLWRLAFSSERAVLILLAWWEGLLSGAIKQNLRAWMI
jgi:hypothetical protein